MSDEEKQSLEIPVGRIQ